MLLRLLLLTAALALGCTGLAQAKSESAIFTVEVSGTFSTGWQSPGKPNCDGSARPDSLAGQVAETGSFHSTRPWPVRVIGLRGASEVTLDGMLGDLAPVAVSLSRTGDASVLTCDPNAEDLACRYGAPVAACLISTPVPADCFGARSYTDGAGVGLTTTSAFVSFPGGQYRAALPCSVSDPELDVRRLMPQTFPDGHLTLPSRRTLFTRAHGGTRFTLHAHDETSGCRDAPSTCTPAVSDAKATFRYVCRSPTDQRSCLTAKLRRRLGIR